jgi:hypothetical protein
LADEVGTSSIAALASFRFTSKIYASLDAHSVAFSLHRFAYRECLRAYWTMFNGRFARHERSFHNRSFRE